MPKSASKPAAKPKALKIEKSAKNDQIDHQPDTATADLSQIRLPSITEAAKASKNTVLGGLNDALNQPIPPDQPVESPITPESAANRFMAASQAESTRMAYASDLRHFLVHGGEIPSNHEAVMAYLTEFAEKLSIATLQRRLVAIHHAHLDYAKTNKSNGSQPATSPVKHPDVQQLMSGIRRTVGSVVRRAQPMMKDDLIRSLLMIERLTPKRRARDAALLTLGFCGAFRRSELVGIKTEHVVFLNAGLEVLLPKSKTDQEGAGRMVFIPYAQSDRCPVRALQAWMQIAQISEGFVFRGVSRHDVVSKEGLSPQSVRLIVQGAIERVGGDAKLYSGHSLRSGFCSQAAVDGWQPWAMMVTTGHRDSRTLDRYIRPITRRQQKSLL
jgi:site-specific recombinase XerD